MAIVATTLLLRVTPADAHDGSVTSLLLDVRPDTTTPPHLLFDVTQVAGALAQFQPGGTNVRQDYVPQITYSIDGTDHVIYPSDLAQGDLVLDMNEDGKSWRWAFTDRGAASTRTSWVAPTVGWPIDYGTVAPGKSPVAYDARYRTAGLAWMDVPLMAEGVTKNSSTDLRSLECSGVGPEGKWDAGTVSLHLDAEHGWTPGQLANHLLVNMTDSDGNSVISASQVLFGDEIGAALNNPVDLDCVPGWATAREILDQAGYALVAGAATDLTATAVALPKADITSASQFTIAEKDILDADIRMEVINADHPKCITVTSNAVDPNANGGSVTTTEIELIYDVFAVPGAYFSQTSSTFAALSSAGPLGSPFLQLKQRTTTRKTVKEGCLTREEVTVERYRNVEAPRYRISAATTDLQFAKADYGAFSTVYVFDQDASDLDSAPAYLWRYDRWTVDTRTVRVLGGLSETEPTSGRLPFWVNEAFFPGQREVDFAYTDASGVTRTLSNPLLAIRDYPVGRERFELTYEMGWFNPPVALKTRADAGDTWELQNHVDDVYLRGDLTGVLFDHEYFFDGGGPLESGNPLWTATYQNIVQGGAGGEWGDYPATGFRLAAFTPSYHPEPEDLYLKFSMLVREYVLGGLVAGDEGGYLTREYTAEKQWEIYPGSTWLFGDGTEGRDWTAEAHTVPVKTELRYDAIGNLAHSETESVYDLVGNLLPDYPKIRRGLQGGLPAMPVCNRSLALGENLVPLRVKICLAPVNDVFVAREEERAADWIETEEGLEEYATRLLREMTSIGQELTIPVDARLVPWKPGTFNFPRRGYTSRRCWVARASITTTPTDRGLQTTMTVFLKVAVI